MHGSQKINNQMRKARKLSGRVRHYFCRHGAGGHLHPTPEGFLGVFLLKAIDGRASRGLFFTGSLTAESNGRCSARVKCLVRQRVGQSLSCGRDGSALVTRVTAAAQHTAISTFFVLGV